MAMSSSKLPVEHHALSFRYALSEPGVACAVIGMATSEELRRNVAWAKSFAPLTQKERMAAAALGRRLAASWGAHFGPVA